MLKRFSKEYLKDEALALVRQREFDKGIKVYHEYLEINPKDDDGWAGLGGAYRRKGDINQSIESYENAFKINRESTYALVNLISLWTARYSKQDREEINRNIHEAVSLVNEDIRSGEADYWTWYDLATLQLIQGDTEEALRSFNYAANLTPATAKENFRSVLNNLNFLKANNPTIKDIDRAIAIINSHLT